MAKAPSEFVGSGRVAAIPTRLSEVTSSGGCVVSVGVSMADIRPNSMAQNTMCHRNWRIGTILTALNHCVQEVGRSARLCGRRRAPGASRHAPTRGVAEVKQERSPATLRNTHHELQREHVAICMAPLKSKNSVKNQTSNSSEPSSLAPRRS